MCFLLYCIYYSYIVSVQVVLQNSTHNQIDCVRKPLNFVYLVKFLDLIAISSKGPIFPLVLVITLYT